MSKRQYLKNLNYEIQKLNGVIDQKIIHELDYKRESLRHKKLLAEIRRQEVKNSFVRLSQVFTPSWF